MCVPRLKRRVSFHAAKAVLLNRVMRVMVRTIFAYIKRTCQGGYCQTKKFLSEALTLRYTTSEAW